MKVHGYLSVIKRDGTDGSNYPVTTQTCTIGRGINNDVRIHVQTVSEEHCKIFISKFGQATLKNLSNTSSTTVNGTPIGDSEVYLGHGDIITAGDRSLRWEYLPDSQHCVASGRNTSPLCGSTAMVGMPISMLQSALGNRTFQRRSFVGSDTRKKFVSRLVTSSSQTPGRINVPVHKGASSERLVAIVSPQQRSRSEKKVSESGAVSSSQFEGSSGASCVDLGTPVTHQLKKSKTPVAASSVVKVSSPDYVTTVTTGSSPREIRSKSAKATKGSNITVKTFYRRRSLQDATVPVPSTTTYSNKRKSAAASLASIINKTPSKRKSTILLAKTPRSMKNKKTSVKSKKKNSTPVSSSKKKAAISASKTLVTQRVERQKRKLESGLRSAERAAKRLKLESPKTPDKKKMAALMVCHGKVSRPQVTPGTKSSAKRSQSVSAVEKESKIPVARFKSRSTARKIVRRKSDTNVTGKDKKSQPLASTYSLKIPESFNFKSEERKKELRVSPIEKVNRNKTPSSKGRRGRSLVSKQPSSPKLEDTINVSGIVELLESPTSIPSSKKVPVTPSSETKQKNSSKISPILLLERISTPRKSRSSELQNLSSHRNTRRKNMHTSFLKSATEDTDENIEEAEKSGTLIITPISGRMSARKLQNRKSVIRTPLSPSGPSNVKKLSSTPRSATSRVSFVATPQSGRKLRYSSRGSQSPKSPVIDVSRMSRSSLKLGDKIKLNRSLTTPSSVRKSKGSAAKIEQMSGQLTPLRRSPGIEDTNMFVSHSGRSNVSVSTRISKGSAVVSPKDNSSFIDSNDTSLSSRKRQSTTPPSVRRSRSSVGSAVKNEPEFGLFTPKRSSSVGDTSRSVSPLSRSGLSASTRKSKGSAIVSPKDNSTFIDFKDDSLSPRRGQTTTPSSVRRSSSSVGSAVKNDTPKRSSSGGDISRSVSPLSRSGLSAATRKSKGSPIVSPKDNSTFIDFKDDSLSPRRGETTTPPSVRRSRSSVGSAVKNDTPKRSSSGGDISRSVFPLSRSGLSVSTRKSKGSAVTLPEDNSAFIDSNDVSSSPREEQVYLSSTTPPSERRSRSSSEIGARNRSLSSSSRTSVSVRTRKYERSPVLSPKDISLSPRTGKFDHFSTTPSSMRESSSTGSAVKNEPEPGLFTPKRSPLGIGDENTSISRSSRSSNVSVSTRKSVGSAVVSLKDNSTFIDTKEVSFSPKTRSSRTPVRNARRFSKIQPLRSSEKLEIVTEKSSISGETTPNSFVLPRSVLAGSAARDQKPSSSKKRVSWSQTPSSLNTTFDFDSVRTPRISLEDFVSPLSSARKRINVRLESKSMSEKKPKSEPPFKRRRLSEQIKEDSFSDMKSESSNESFITSEVQRWKTNSRQAVSLSVEYAGQNASIVKENHVVRRSFRSAMSPNNVRGAEVVVKSLRSTKSPKNDLSNVHGIKRLMKTPKSPKNDLSNIKGVKQLMKTPRSQRSPKNDLSDVHGVKQIMKTPRVQKSPKNDLTNIPGVKRLMKTPRSQKSPKNDLSDVRGVKQLLGTPKSPKSPKNDLSDVRGVGKLMKTPRSPKSPKNDLRDVRGVRKLMKTPRSPKSPRNDLSDVRGVKQLLGTPKSPKSPKNDLSDVRGVRKLMKTPRSPKSPKNDLRDVRGVKRLMKSPRIQKSPKNDLTNVEGVKELMKSPKAAGLYKDSSLGGTDVKSLTSPKSPQSGRQTARAQVKSKSQRNVTSPEKEAPLQNSRTRNRRANLAQQSPKSEAAVAEGNTSKTLLTLIPQEEKVISAVADSTTATTRSTRNKKGSTSIESSSEPPKKRGRKEESKIYADEDLPSQSKSGARVHFDIPGTPPTPVRSSRRKKVTDVVTSPVEKGTRKLKGSTEETKPADGLSDHTIIPSPPGRRTRGTKVPVKEATPTRSKRGAKKVVEVDSPPKQQQNISVVNEDTHPAKRKRGTTATVVIDSSPLTKRKRVATVAASAESPVPSKNRRVAESAVEVEVPHSPVVRKTRGRTATVVAVSSSADGSISDFDTTKQQKTKSSGSPVKRGKRGAKVVEVTPIIAENSSDVITPKQAESASRSPVKRGKRGGKVVKATSVTAESSSDVITTRQTEKDSGTPVKRGKRGTKVIELSVTPESPKRLRGAKTSEENVSADTKTRGKKSRVVSSPVSKSKSPSPLATRRTARQTKKKEVSNDNVTPDRKTRSSRRKR